jgi:hypothetical protein
MNIRTPCPSMSNSPFVTLRPLSPEGPSLHCTLCMTFEFDLSLLLLLPLLPKTDLSSLTDLRALPVKCILSLPPVLYGLTPSSILCIPFT